MSNDLLFPILPRNTKVPIETDDSVKKVQKTKKSEHFSEEERDQFQDVKRTEIIENQLKTRKIKSEVTARAGLSILILMFSETC